jgi:putative colanic acid biosynthesis glycosyltransferase
MDPGFRRDDDDRTKKLANLMETHTKTPLFSIITVTRDNLRGVLATGNSVKMQSIQNLKEQNAEWIVIDGASNDGTGEWLADSGAQFISEPDRGIYDAMNKGISMARGEYILFLNAGDMLAGPAVLDVLARAIASQKTPPDFIYGDSLECTGGTTHRKPARGHNRIDFGMFTHHQSMIYRRAAIGNLRYDDTYKISADYEFTARILKNACSVLYCPMPICVFEGGGVSQQKSGLGRREQFTARRRMGMAWPKNIFIYAAQTMAWEFRRALPGLYWLLKSSGNSPRGFARTGIPAPRP